MSDAPMVQCPCGNVFVRERRRGRPRQWCYDCRPFRGAPEPEPEEEAPSVVRRLVIEDGAVKWDDGSEVTETIALPAGNRLVCVKVEDRWEVVGVERPTVVETGKRTAWIMALDRKRESLGKRLPEWREKLEDKEAWMARASKGSMEIEPWGVYPMSLLRAKVRALEEEVAAYNELAAEFRLPLVQA